MDKRTGTGLGSRVSPVVLSLRGVLTTGILANPERTTRTSKREAKVGGPTIPGISAKLLRAVFPLALCLSSLVLAAAVSAVRPATDFCAAASGAPDSATTDRAPGESTPGTGYAAPACG
jgi:hypothetical protein